MEILISGYFGFENIGDEAILSSTIKNLKTYFPRAEITVLSSTPKETSRIYQVKSINRMNFFSIISNIIKCDIFLSGGGGLLQDVTGTLTPIYYLLLVAIAKLFGKKVAVIGQGYGPITNNFNKFLVKRILNKVNLITLRDNLSKESLISLGVKKPPIIVCADIALLLEKKSFIEILRAEKIYEFNRPAIGVAVRSFKKMPDDFVPRIAEALDEIINRYGYDVLFIPFKHPEDLEFSVNILGQMKNGSRVLEGHYLPEEILGIVGSLDYLIGSRLHSLIFGLKEKIPSLGITYDPKVRIFCDEAQILYIDPDFSKKTMLDCFERLINEKEKIKSNYEEKFKALQEKAKLNFISLSKYLNIVDSVNILGVRVDNIELNQAIEKCEEFISSKNPHLIFTPNPEIIMQSQKDNNLKEILNMADINLPDGIGILFASKYLNRPIKKRITGIDFMMQLLIIAKQKDYKVFLLGGNPGVAEAAAKNLKGVNIVGVHHGYFNENKDNEIVEMIKKTSPDILFVGLGSPKQEKWLAKYYKIIGAPVNMVVGGSFDVLSGKTKRAPVFIQRIGLEWLYRLTKEPTRWKRQLKLANFVFQILIKGKNYDKEK